MGLDINVRVDNPEEVFDDNGGKYFHLHSLSRTFCNLMCRKDVVQHKPELEQIATITGVDISPIHEMDKYCDEFCVAENLEFMDTEAEKKRFLKQVTVGNARIENNIERVLKTLSDLIEQLSKIPDLYELLEPTDFDTLDSKYYFSDFNSDKGEGYIDNNFGQDLRNFKRFVEYAKERGTKTVYFNYG